MSDDQTSVPAPPAVPEVSSEETPAPQVQTGNPEQADESVALKTPPSLAGSGTPQSDSEATEGEGAGKETDEGSEAATGASEGQEEAKPNDPVVETTPGGQTVTMPDGRVVHTRFTDAPVSNSEWQQYELTHQGGQVRYQYVPGDREYSPYSDPAVPNSHLAQMVEREITSFAERVVQDVEAEVSPIWNQLKGVYDGELKEAIATGGGEGKVQA